MTKEIIETIPNPQKNKGGRPRAFKTPEEMQVLIDEYFEIKSGFKRQMVLKSGAIAYIPDPQPVHIAGLCAYLGLTHETLLQYQKKEEFSEPIKQAKQMCEEYAVDMCFRSKNKADFVLMNNFGWRNRVEQENKGHSTVGLTSVVTQEELEAAKEKLKNDSEN